jgi:hypothetical protein
MADRSGYIGRAPSDSSVTVARQTNQPTGVTTTFVFNSGYDVGYLDVYVNGSKLINALDYTATDTQNISLTTAAVSGDVVEFVAYKAFNLSNVVSSTPGNLTVGGDLTVDGIISGDGSGLTSVGIGTTGSINTSGIITASKFVGDGSELTGVSGFATALSTDQTSPLNTFFKTPKQVTIGAGTSVTVQSDTTSGDVAFIRESIVHVAVGATFHIKTNNTLVTNVLGVF